MNRTSATKSTCCLFWPRSDVLARVCSRDKDNKTFKMCTYTRKRPDKDAATLCFQARLVPAFTCTVKKSRGLHINMAKLGILWETKPVLSKHWMKYLHDLSTWHFKEKITLNTMQACRRKILVTHYFGNCDGKREHERPRLDKHSFVLCKDKCQKKCCWGTHEYAWHTSSPFRNGFPANTETLRPSWPWRGGKACKDALFTALSTRHDPLTKPQWLIKSARGTRADTSLPEPGSIRVK